MTVSMVVFWGLVIVGVVALVRYLGRSAQRTGAVDTHRPKPDEILAERFARGEIDEQEYRSRRNALGSSPTSGES